MITDHFFGSMLIQYSHIHGRPSHVNTTYQHFMNGFSLFFVNTITRTALIYLQKWSLPHALILLHYIVKKELRIMYLTDIEVQSLMNNVQSTGIIMLTMNCCLYRCGFSKVEADSKCFTCVRVLCAYKGRFNKFREYAVPNRSVKES